MAIFTSMELIILEGIYNKFKLKILWVRIIWVLAENLITIIFTILLHLPHEYAHRCTIYIKNTFVHCNYLYASVNELNRALHQVNIRKWRRPLRQTKLLKGPLSAAKRTQRSRYSKVCVYHTKSNHTFRRNID